MTNSRNILRLSARTIPPFIKIGSKVTPDTTVCLVEAMKVFNQIQAEVSGTIVEVLAKTGDAVDFGQPLFRVKIS
ncbi:MAG: biotin/lipoyl-containing protein [Planctomycetaceae bacterium]